MPTLGTGGPPTKTPSTPGMDLSYEEITQGEVIGQGDNADVYRVSVERNGRSIPIAVKQPRLAGTLQSMMREQFAAEAELWNRLDDDDHVVSLIDWGTEPRPWLAMEYMDGGALTDLLEDGGLPLEQAVWVALCVCRAVQYAHQQGVIHHDINPSNVLFRKTESGWAVPKVSDWGVARTIRDETGSVGGFPPQYSAPEQFDNTTYGTPDDVTDIYQVGVVAYELTTGVLPFDGPTTNMIQHVLNEEPDPPSAVAEVPPTLDDVVMPALEKRKQDRYDSIEQLCDGLERVFETLRGSSTPPQPNSAVSSSEIAPQGEFLSTGETNVSKPTHTKTQPRYTETQPTESTAPAGPNRDSAEPEALSTDHTSIPPTTTADRSNATESTQSQSSSPSSTDGSSRRSYLKIGAAVAGTIGVLGVGVTVGRDEGGSLLGGGGSGGLGGPTDDANDSDRVPFPTDDIELFIPGVPESIYDRYSRMTARQLEQQFPERSVDVRYIDPDSGPQEIQALFAENDPHTLAFIETTNFINHQLTDSVTYDLTEFRWLSQISEMKGCLYVSEESQITTVDEYVESLHRENIQIAHYDERATIPTAATVFGVVSERYPAELMAESTVLYDSFGAAIESTIRGETDVFSGFYTPGIADINGIEPLVTFHLGEPPEETPNTETLSTAGIDGAETIQTLTTSRSTFAAPPEIDHGIHETLAESFETAVTSDELREEAEDDGWRIEYRSAEAIKESIASTMAAWERNQEIAEILFE